MKYMKFCLLIVFFLNFDFLLLSGDEHITNKDISSHSSIEYSKKLHQLYRYTVPLIKPLQLKKEMELNPPPVILDTRELREYEVSHIKGAIQVGYKAFKLDLVKEISLDTPLVVYCSLGVRSEEIGEKLIKAGFENVRNLLGGIFEWMYHDLPVFDKKEHSTHKVHVYSKKWGKWLRKGEKVYK